LKVLNLSNNYLTDVAGSAFALNLA